MSECTLSFCHHICDKMKLGVKFYGDYNVITEKLCNRAIHYIYIYKIRI